jgi:hypothetical protein
MQDPRRQTAFPRPTRPLVWLIAAALGAGAALLAVVIGVFGIFFVLLIIPGMGARTWLAATSGALTGFGATTLALLLVRPATASGVAGAGTLLMLAGVIPLAIGLALGGLALVISRSPRS